MKQLGKFGWWICFDKATLRQATGVYRWWCQCEQYWKVREFYRRTC